MPLGLKCTTHDGDFTLSFFIDQWSSRYSRSSATETVDTDSISGWVKLNNIGIHSLHMLDGQQQKGIS